MNRLHFIKIVLILFLFSLDLSAKTRLPLNHGMMKAGGHMTLPISIPKEGGTVVGLELAPEFDYFVAHGFAIGIRPTVERTSLTAENFPWTFSVAVLGTFFFDLGGAIYPYIGGGGGIGWKTKIKGVAFQLTAPVGMLVALNNHVGIDFGVPLKFHFTGDGYYGASLPVGYLGIQAFF